MAPIVSNVFLDFCILTDVDECVEDPTICGPNSNCTNSIGSYSCVCVSGYRLDNLAVIASIANPCTGACSLVWYLCDIHCTVCVYIQYIYMDQMTCKNR